MAEVVRFGVFEVNRTTGELRKGGVRIRLQDQPFQILLMLLDRPGEVVTREEIQRRLWPEGTFVEFENSIGTAVKKLRQALGDDADTPRYIETLPRRGFRFVAPVESPGAEPSPLRSETRSEPGPAIITRHKKAAIGSVAVMAALVAGTWFFLHRPPRPPAGLTQKRLTFNSNENPVQSAVISPDGKYLAYSDGTVIRVKLLSTDEERAIPRPAGVPAGAYWLVDSWFPDGTQLLAHANESGGHKSIWTLSVLGQSSPRQLREGAQGFGVSPDGTRVAFIPLGATDYAREIWVMSSQGDNPQKILAVGENEWLEWVRWSPDGQRLAYVRVQGTQLRSQRRIETCDLKGTSRAVVVPDTDLLAEFCWLPEGRIVYARQDSPDSSDSNLWQVGIDNHAGTPTGKPRRITQWGGFDLSAVSASANGERLVLLKQTYQAQVYLGELEAGGTRMKPPRRLTNDEAWDRPTAWMPDSTAVLFGSNRNGTMGIYRQGISQETAEPVVAGRRDAFNPRLSADGAWILFAEIPAASADPSPPHRMMRIPVNGGVPQFVLETRRWLDFACARAPANLCIILDTSQDLKQLMITALDPVKGRGKVLRTIENDPLHTYGDPALSPDGSTCAISRDGEPQIHIRLLSPSGGSDREITVKGWPNLTGLDWSPDGKGFYVGSVSPQGSTLLYVDLKGNARVLWQYKAGNAGIWGLPSPDGRYLAIMGDVINSNVWMVEGF